MQQMTPMKAIRAKCLDCTLNQPTEVAQCPCTDCSLWPYRFGRNPNIKPKEYTEEERQKMRDRLAANLGRNAD